MDLVDLHCHLDLYPDFPEIIEECERERVYTLAVTTTPAAWTRNRDLTEGKKFVRAALGLHPQLVATRGSELSLWESLAENARYIGEIGLDGSRAHIGSFPLQQRVFKRILEVSNELGGKILTVHSLAAVGTVLDMLEATLRSSSTQVVMHWFTGTANETARALDLGCYFSVNQAMTKTERGTQILNVIPVNRLLTETDGPFTLLVRSPPDLATCGRL